MTILPRLTSPKAFRVAAITVLVLGGFSTVAAALTADGAIAVSIALATVAIATALSVGYVASVWWTSASRALNEQGSSVTDLIHREAEITSVVGRQENHNKALVDRVQSLESAGSRQENHNKALVDRVRSLEADRGRQAGFNEAVLDRVRSLEAVLDRVRSLEAAGENVQRSLDEVRAVGSTVTGRNFHAVRRVISDSEASELLRILPEQLGLDWTRSHIEYLQRSIIGLELSGSGRLAAHSVDAVLRLAATLSRRAPTEHLEIGVLSGEHAALLGEVAAGLGRELRQTLIDPLDGYYGESELDALTLTTISEANVVRNLSLAGVSPKDYRILKGVSTDDAIIEAASDRQYDTILIDGDHSYEGVRDDIALYRPMLAPGGLLILDDYGNDAWQDVSRAVDDAVEAGAIEIVATLSKTALATPAGTPFG